MKSQNHTHPCPELPVESEIVFKKCEQQANEINTVSIFDLLGILIKYRKMTFLATSAAALFIFVYCLISILLPPKVSYMPNLFTASSQVLIKEENNNNMAGVNATAVKMMGLGVLQSGAKNSDLALTLGKSNTIIDTLVNNFDLVTYYGLADSDRSKSGVRSIIRSNLLLELDESTGIIEISYRDVDPKLATAVANRTVELLEQRFDTINDKASLSHHELIQKKIRVATHEINQIEAEMLDFQEMYKILDANAAANSLSSHIGRIKGEMIRIDTEVSALKKRFGEQNSLINEKNWEKSTLQKQLQLIVQKGDYEIPAFKDMPNIQLHFRKLQRELALKTSVLTELQRQLELNRLQSQGTEDTFQVLEAAEIPETKSSPARAKLCILFTFGAFFLAVLAGFIRESLSQALKDEDVLTKLHLRDIWFFKTARGRKHLIRLESYSQDAPLKQA